MSPTCPTSYGVGTQIYAYSWHIVYELLTFWVFHIYMERAGRQARMEKVAMISHGETERFAIHIDDVRLDEKVVIAGYYWSAI